VSGHQTTDNNLTTSTTPILGSYHHHQHHHQEKSSTNNKMMKKNGTNYPPIYDTKYIYLIDCRLDRREFQRDHIHTAIHFQDLLQDNVFVSLNQQTSLVVIYDADGSLLTSLRSLPVTPSSSYSSSSSSSSSSPEFMKAMQNPSEIVAKIRNKFKSNNSTIISKPIFILNGGYNEFQRIFPFMCSKLEIRSTVDRQKYLTIYPNCVIEDQFYIGSAIQAKNWKVCRDLRISHIINCSKEHECSFKGVFISLILKISNFK
jgi:hypothetical protein